ncbi:Spherulin-1A [Grifola frondosa]|uniref:Spherulin-1A n=1 Tax=Grifola frondosa TaxID=5627 RepID=A0A1C7LZE4_GRIFR|nr:Spherulin-1A [Grifola frondosa]
MMLSTLILSLALGSSGIFAQSIADEIIALRDAPTQVARIGILKDDSDFVFNFLNASSGIAKGAGGMAVGATVANFPALVNNGLAMTIGFLAEILYVVNGSISSGMLAENGARFVYNDVPAGSATIFPKGSIHYQQNNGCDPITFVAALNNEDPGVESIAQRYPRQLRLGHRRVPAALRHPAGRPTHEPAAAAPPVERAPVRLQRAPAPGTTSSASSSSSSSSPSSTATSTHYTRDVQQTQILGALSGASSGVSGASSTQPVTIALIVVVGVMALGYFVMAVLFFMGRRRRADKERSYIRPDMSGRYLVPTVEEKYDSSSHPPALQGPTSLHKGKKDEYMHTTGTNDGGSSKESQELQESTQRDRT